MSVSESDNRDKSEFNMAVSYLNRLNSLFYVADNSAISLDVYTWFHSLMAIFRELSTEMKAAEISEWEQKSFEINRCVGSYICDVGKLGRSEIDHDLYMRLHSFEMKLRKVMKESGLQTKMTSDPRFAIT